MTFSIWYERRSSYEAIVTAMQLNGNHMAAGSESTSEFSFLCHVGVRIVSAEESKGCCCRDGTVEAGEQDVEQRLQTVLVGCRLQGKGALAHVVWTCPHPLTRCLWRMFPEQAKEAARQVHEGLQNPHQLLPGRDEPGVGVGATTCA